jgi:hypothetical protein
MSKFRSAIRAAAQRNMLDRLLDGRQLIQVTRCHALSHLNKEAAAAFKCVAEARDLARYRDGREPSSHDVVRQIADNIIRGLPLWHDGILAASALVTAIDAVEAGETGDAISAVSWAVAAARDQSLVGWDRHDRLVVAALSVAVKAVKEGDHDDRFLAGALLLAVASVLRATRSAPIASTAETQVETELSQPASVCGT